MGFDTSKADSSFQKDAVGYREYIESLEMEVPDREVRVGSFCLASTFIQGFFAVANPTEEPKGSTKD